MLGSPLFDGNNINGSQQGDPQNNPNLAHIMNMMQSPAPGMPPQFNPYRPHQVPHQRFPYMNPGMHGYSELMRFQAQQPPHHMGGPPFNQSPVSSPEEMRKRAAQAQAQAHQQGFFPYPPDAAAAMHLNQMNRGPGAGFPNRQAFQQFGQIGEPSMPPLPQTLSQYPNIIDHQLQQLKSSSNADSNSPQERAASSSPPHKLLGTPHSKKKHTPSLESIVKALKPSSMPIMSSDGDVDLNPLGTILNSGPDGRGKGRGRGRGGRGSSRGRGKGRGGRGGKKGVMSLTKTQEDGTIVLIDDSNMDDSPEKKDTPVYYTGSIALGLEEDQFWLSELQVFLRSNFAEVFGASDSDISAPMHGRNKPIALGQVGIRCIHCKDEPVATRGQQAVSYPSLVSGIYNSVQQMFRLHFDCCTAMPVEIKAKIETLRASSSSRGGRKQYWIDSAKRLGLIDTPHGIHFERDPTGPLPPLAGPSGELTAGLDDKDEPMDDGIETEESGSPQKSGPSLLSAEHTDELKRQKEEAYPLVLPEDEDLISDYLYLTIVQMEPCKLMDADRVGCYKGREIGFRGLACKWCVGQAGCGRYFPSSEASLSQTTTSQTILNHVRSCRRCPADIREQLEAMKRGKTGPDGKKNEKPKHGGRKVFFHRLWCRIQGLEIEDIENVEVKIGRQKGAKNKVPSKKRRRKRSIDSDAENDRDDDETETEDDDEDSPKKKKKRRHRKDSGSLGRKKSLGHIPVEDVESSADEASDSEKLPDATYPGCVSLNKSDDGHWLSELQCFIRSDLVEAFAVSTTDAEEGLYDDAEELQVGIRCKYCGMLPRHDKPEGHCYFPHSLSAIQSCVSDLHRRHFSSCKEIPEEVRKTFKSLRGFSGKAEGETQQYWIDSAREIGLFNSTENAGIRFFRNPYEPSPADDFEKERSTSVVFDVDANKRSLTRPNDVATHHALLLLKQVRPCRFKSSDRRGGSGSRGRDRVLGFPGIACIHCSSKNTTGRYFPFAAKSLADNTYASLQAHISTCHRCPEAVKASLAYLFHRSTLEKAELGGGWKKSFFKQVWDRLHVERAWSSKEVKESTPEEERGSESDDEDDEDIKVEADDVGVDESLDSGIGEMVKAAAQWLTDRDAAENDSSQEKSKSKGAPRRSLPLGRGLPSRILQSNSDSKGVKHQTV